MGYERRMDVSRGFKAMFGDPKWALKLLLALVFSILIVTGPAVIGYWMRYVRNVAEGHDDVLPEWNEFGTYWVHGVLVILAAIVYVIVGLILLVIGIIPAVILLQAAVVEYAMTEQAGSLFALRTIWHRITTTTSFWVAWVIGLGLSVGVNVVSSVFTTPNSAASRSLGFIIGAVLGLYVSFVEADLYGQYARDAYGLTTSPGTQPPHGAYPPPPPSPGGYAPPPPLGGAH
jgi:hypothetical protein